MKLCQIALCIALGVIPLWNEAPAAENTDELHRAANVIGQYLFTLYSNDRIENGKTTVPHPESAAAEGRDKLTGEDLLLVHKEISGLRLSFEEPFLYHGKKATPDKTGAYPVGTSVCFMTQSRGTVLVIPVVKLASGWKVDDRFWIAMSKEYQENDPESVIRKFLYCLVARNEDELKKLVVAGSDLRPLLAGKAPFEDQYYALVAEMPIVEALDGDGMLLADGKAVVARTATGQSKWFSGLYAHKKLVFELRQEEQQWRVVPKDYLSVIGIGRKAPPIREEQGEVKITLPPLAVDKPAEPPPQMPVATPTPTAQYKLNGTMGKKGDYRALINNQIFKVGDKLGTGKILAIEATQVTIQATDGTVATLRMDADGTDRATPGDAALPPALRKGLLAYYPFNRDEGDRVSDLSDCQRNATAENVEWTPLGKSGGALVFNGRDSFITLPNPEAINRLHAMTFSAWVNLRTMPSDFSGIVSRRIPSELWWFGVKNGLGLQLYLSGRGNGGDRTTGTGTIATGSWCHAVFTYESGRASAIYINGKLLNVVHITGSLPGDEVTPVRIGRGVGPSETFDGTIDEVMIFDRALTDEEVARLYEAGKDTPLPFR